MKKRNALEPLDIKCTDSDCENDLHCFLATKKMIERNEAGLCRECGAELVDWYRVHRRDIVDAEFTIEMLEYELIRHHFWHIQIDQWAVNYARRKGWINLLDAARNRIAKSVGPSSPFRDGQQTPREKNPIYYAQHATATCCRRCIEEWHGLPKGRALTDDEIDYMTELCMLYLKRRLPQVTEYGEKVPPIRSGNG